MPITIFDVDGIPGRPLLSAALAIACTYNPRPEQKVAHYTEGTGHEDQLPSARTQPAPGGLLLPLNPSQQVLHENEETQHRRQLVTVRAMVLADREFFSCRAVVGEKEPNDPDSYVQRVMA
jgi:hypothetical protein